MTLAELRSLSGRSQTDLAERLGTTQSGVSRIERQDDTRISTLAEYVAHVGGRLRLVVERPDGDVELIVPALTPTEYSQPRRSRVVWQNERSRSFHAVGSLEFDGRIFRFAYAPDVAGVRDFVPFESFPSFDKVYESPELFDFFARRIPRAADPSFHSVLEALGLARRDATPAELMRYPLATPKDPVQIFPEPIVDRDGSVEGTFLVSGIRYADAESNGLAGNVIDRLRPGDPLDVAPEPKNPVNPHALAVSADQVRLGYVPDYLLPDLGRLIDEGRDIRFHVERANEDTVDWHLRLLARFSSSASGPEVA